MPSNPCKQASIALLAAGAGFIATVWLWHASGHFAQGEKMSTPSWKQDHPHPPAFPRSNTWNLRPQPMLAEQMNTLGAERLLGTGGEDIGQRNEAANRLRVDAPSRLLAMIERILADPHETELFKSWMVQHVGVLAPELPEADEAAWSERLKSVVTSAEVSKPLWRESIFALSAFRPPTTRKWVLAYIEGLSDAQRSANAPILADIIQPKAATPPEGEILDLPFVEDLLWQ